MKYIKNLSEPWFSLIKIGAKTCEGRLNKGDFLKMEIGDEIVFENNDLGFKRNFTVRVTGKKEYKGFSEYLENEKLSNCLPGIDTQKQGEDVYYKYYSKDDEKNYGVVGIRFVVVTGGKGMRKKSKERK